LYEFIKVAAVCYQSQVMLQRIFSRFKFGRHGDSSHGLEKDTRSNVQYQLLSVAQTQAILNVTSLEAGLPLAESVLSERRLRYGSNEIATRQGIQIGRLLFRNFVNPMSAILAAVMIISAVNGDWIEFGIVGSFILINGILGSYNEYGSEKALAALQKMTSGSAFVIRDSQRVQIPIDEVVVGDICDLEQGQIVPADMRLMDVNHLDVDESLLTGESLPVHKQVDLAESVLLEHSSTGTDSNIQMALSDWKNVCFRQTAVVSGRGRGIVYAVGKDTQVGKLAEKLAAPNDQPSPLQRRLNRLMYVLLVCAIVLAGVVFAVEQSFDESTTLYASAVGIAILPESLLVTITVTMTVGVRRMAKHKAIVRRLKALEVLSELTDVCSDKTGTLTEGKMVAVRMVLGDRLRFRVTGPALNRFGDIEPETNVEEDEDEVVQPRRHPLAMERLLQAAALCTNATVLMTNDEGDLDVTGNPTEVALQVLCWKAKVPRALWEHRGWVRHGEWAFSSQSKMMSVGYVAPDEQRTSFVFVKGAPERLLACCTSYLEPTSEHAELRLPLTTQVHNRISALMSHLASTGLRVIAFAFRDDLPLIDSESGRSVSLHDIPRPEVETKLIFVGLVGIVDPPRAESAPAVALCKRAGIRVRMLTGDVTETAESIARTLGILRTGGLTMTGPQFDSLDVGQVDQMEELPSCIARCSPDTKVNMVQALQRRKRIVLMTGDGMNDAPALKMADVGVAMGSGSDVTKGIADIVLTNDSFASIVKAIAEGRRIQKSLRNFVKHLLSANVAQVLALIVGLAFVDDASRSVYVLSPVEILYVNALSGLATMGLAFDKARSDVMHQPPLRDGLFTAELVSDILVLGCAMGALTLVNFVLVLYVFGDGLLREDCNLFSESCETVAKARATAFGTIFILLMLQTYVVRVGRRSVFQQQFFNNRFLWVAVTLGTLSILPMLYIPTLAQDVFHHTQISWHWGLIAGAIVVYIAFRELYAWCKRRLFAYRAKVAIHREQEQRESRRSLDQKGGAAAELRVDETMDDLQAISRIARDVLPPPVSEQIARRQKSVHYAAYPSQADEQV
jgi:potassium/sodium efflux P-type ATPase